MLIEVAMAYKQAVQAWVSVRYGTVRQINRSLQLFARSITKLLPTCRHGTVIYKLEGRAYEVMHHYYQSDRETCDKVTVRNRSYQYIERYTAGPYIVS
jgi:hypothetical protein